MPIARDVDRVLGGYGIRRRPGGGYAWRDLTAAADARGWRYQVEIKAGPRGIAPYRAMVWWRVEGPYATQSVRGRGATEEEALAQAVATALGRRACSGATNDPEPAQSVEARR